MHILITGGSGFVGAQLAFYFARRGHSVTVMDNLVRRGSELNLPLFKQNGVEFVHGDVRCREDFANLTGGVDVLVDASAQPSLVYGYANPVFDLTNNTFGLVNALEFARHRGCPLIFCSTNRVYSADRINALPRREEATRWVWDAAAWKTIPAERRPAGFDPVHGIAEEFSVDGGQHGIYGLSKIMADLACQEYADAFGVNTVVNRFGVLAGQGQFGKSEQGWTAWWAIAFHFGLPLRLIGWGGKQLRDVLFIDDVCRLVEIEIEKMDRASGQVFNLGGGPGQTVSLVEATDLMRRKFGRDVPVTLEPEPRKADLSIYVSDIRKAQRVLGWSPRVGIEEGFDRIIAWVRENEDGLRSLYCEERKAVSAR
jgi:CDP-paratose 2-epimerase